jgi:hypothetical protein
VKKLLLIAAAAAAAGAVVFKKLRSDQAEQDLWTEATNDESLDLR